MHVEGTKLELHLRYEKVLKDIILYLKKFDDIEIVFKLHPREGVCCFPFKDIDINISLDERNKNIY